MSNPFGLKDGHDASGQVWLGERCKSERCRGYRVVAWMVVRDEDWQAVAGDTGINILCPACFDALAQFKGVRYKVVNYGISTWHDDAMEAKP